MNFKSFTVQSMAINSSGYIYAGTLGGGVYRSTDDGNSWTTLDAVPCMTVAVSSEGNIVAGSYVSNCQRSTDGGISWKTVEALSCSTLVTTAQGMILSFGGTYLALPSKVSPDTWTGIFVPYPNDAPWNYKVNIMSEGVNDFVFEGTTNAMYRSTDYGASWESINVGLPRNKFGYSSLDVIDSTSRVRWHETGPDVRDIGFDSQGAIYVSCLDGIYRSTNNGNQWVLYLKGYIGSILIDKNNFLYVGSPDGGVYTTSQAVTSVAASPSGLPEQFGLMQNYPNPFNPSTTIRYQLSHDSKVSLQIFNVLGQRVAELVNDEVKAGYREIVWDASAASGIYFYRLEATATDGSKGHYVDVKKMLLLR